MTISTTVDRREYAGNDVTVAFSFPYYFLANADLVVIERNDTTGVETTKTLTTHYTVSGAGVGAGGTVTMLVAPATGVSLIIYRDPALTQGVDLVNNDPLPVETAVEQPLDRLTMISQRNRTLIGTCLRLPAGDTGFSAADMQLPPEVTRAGKYLAFDDDGKPIASDGTGTDPAASSYMATLLDDTTAGAALTTLGISAFIQTLLDDLTANAALTTLTATRAETGAIAVPVLTKLRERISVKDFLPANFVIATDDAASYIQAALDAATTVGVKYVDGGGLSTPYLIGTAIKMPSNVILINAYIKIKNSANVDAFVSYAYPSSGSCDDSGIMHCIIDGNKANNTNNGSGVLYGANRFRFMFNKVLGGDGTIPLLRTSSDCWICFNTVLDSATDGITIYDGSNRNFLIGNTCDNSAGYGILVQGLEVDGQTVSVGNILAHNHCRNNTFDGICMLNGGNQTLIYGNECADNDNKGINIYSNVTVALTVATRNLNITIANNICKNNDSDDGIKVWDDGTANIGAQDILIVGNRCFDDQGVATQATGIALQNGADYVFVTGNNVRGNGSNTIVIGGGVNANGKVWGNIGYVTRKSGADTCADGNTINHGLSLTPTSVRVNCSVSGEFVSVTAKGGTNFTCAIKKHDNTAGTSQTIYWEADAE
jgi:hypothetical protein